MVQMPHSFGRISAILIIFSFVGHQPLDMGLILLIPTCLAVVSSSIVEDSLFLVESSLFS